jgi:predicted nucleic acid-binding protein
MMNKTCAVDTNVLIYLHDKSDIRKRKIAENILAEQPKIAAQVISEYLNVTRKILDLSKVEIIKQCAALFKDNEIIQTTYHILVNASMLIEKYHFQIFDSIIVASALAGNCSVLYSEDMQDGLVIKNMTIKNPFSLKSEY